MCQLTILRHSRDYQGKYLENLLLHLIFSRSWYWCSWSSLRSVLTFVLTNSLRDEQAFIQGLWPYFFTDMVQGTPSCAGWRFETWEWSDAWEEAWTEAWPWPLIAWTWLWFSFAVAPVSTWIPDAVVMIFGGWISTQIVTFVVGVGNDIHLSRLTCPTVPRISLLTRVAMVFDLDRGTSSIVLQRSSNDWAERRRTGTFGLRGGGGDFLTRKRLRNARKGGGWNRDANADIHHFFYQWNCYHWKKSSIENLHT